MLETVLIPTLPWPFFGAMLEDTIKMLNSDESLDLFRPEKYRKIVTHM